MKLDIIEIIINMIGILIAALLLWWDQRAFLLYFFIIVVWRIHASANFIRAFLRVNGMIDEARQLTIIKQFNIPKEKMDFSTYFSDSLKGMTQKEINELRNDFDIIAPKLSRFIKL
ncbi:MAG: hypothetical protein C4522_07985 [Desulfobacteraceae bacterium]|nr:MAG: hypothetical protein C4522_07985 [Desulfobacteraceae bacterium]